ncbi:hypothetical protein ACFSTA_16540 [Ornithinibacillus salinisoli]|uniref:Uncharacterized protein n=1 Tax=Ornithinibacillus salinisoli TaxID=1848459 RepID=A0ABW4W0F9_9BACI
MNHFIKWFVVSISLALIGLIVVSNVEDWTTLSGETNRKLLFLGTSSTFVLVFLSVFFLFKANFERKKSKIVISVFTSLFPLVVLVMNSLIFTVWFIEK